MTVIGSPRVAGETEEGHENVLLTTEFEHAHAAEDLVGYGPPPADLAAQEAKENDHWDLG